MSELLAPERSPTATQALRQDRGDASTQRFEVLWAQQPSEVREAQRLRYRVFAEEMGSQLNPLPGSPVGHDVDRFDSFCEHLLVRAVGHTDEPGAHPVGTGVGATATIGSAAACAACATTTGSGDAAARCKLLALL